jgi:hypothetical protein
MAKNRDNVIREVIAEQVRAYLSGNDILIQDILKYTQSNSFTNVRQIPDLGYVQYLIAQTGGSNTLTKSYSDMDGTHSYFDLTADLSGSQTVAIMTVNGVTSGISNDPANINHFYPLSPVNSGDVVLIYLLGVPTAPPPPPPTIPVPGEMLIINNSTGNITYEDNFGPTTNLASGSVYDKNPFLSGQNVRVDYSIGKSLILTRYNSLGGVISGDPQTSQALYPYPGANIFGGMDITLGYKIEVIDTPVIPYPITVG